MKHPLYISGIIRIAVTENLCTSKPSGDLKKWYYEYCILFLKLKVVKTHFNPLTSLITQAHLGGDALPLPTQT